MSTQVIEYSQFVSRLAKPGEAIVQELSPSAAHNLHMAVGISGEAGELLDAIKKQAIYGKSLDMDNVIEELGDIEFYLQGLRDNLGVTREQVIQANIEKLSNRYTSGSYSNAAAQARLDKVPSS